MARSRSCGYGLGRAERERRDQRCHDGGLAPGEYTLEIRLPKRQKKGAAETALGEGGPGNVLQIPVTSRRRRAACPRMPLVL